MEVVRRIDEFLGAPSGRCLRSEKFAYWSVDPGLWGTTAWGHLDDDMVARLTEVVAREFRLELPPYAAIVDMRRVTSIDERAFVRWGAFLTEHRATHAARVRREVVVRPTGEFTAALVSGYAQVIDVDHPFVVMGSVTDALAWLGRSDALATVDQMAELARGDLVERCRAALVPPFALARLELMAAHLGVSARTLQRRLKEAGTSFHTELARARIVTAQRMMLQEDAKLGAVALAVGFASQAHFTEAFRREAGVPPGEWRARHQPR